MGDIVQFEIHGTEPQALIDFYSGLFGWQFRKWDGVDFWQISISSESTSIGGGLVPRRGPSPDEGQAVNAFVCTVQVDSVDESFSVAESLGGTIAVPKIQIPGVGWLGYIKDPDGNLLGLSQPADPR
jgi:predicted enzyme related to lactoylglutathione lyase